MDGIRLLICFLWSGLLFFTAKSETYRPNLSGGRTQNENDRSEGYDKSDVQRAFSAARNSLARSGKGSPNHRSASGERKDADRKSYDADDSSDANSEALSAVQAAAKLHQFFQGGTPDSTLRAAAEEEFLEAHTRLTKSYDVAASDVAGKSISTKELRKILGEDSSTIKRCDALLPKPHCNRNYEYRTIDGSCNNIKHPTWGVGKECDVRLLPAVYHDGIQEIRRSVSGCPLPRARDISVNIHSHLNREDHKNSHMVMVWGQFIDHDITLTPVNSKDQNGVAYPCCTTDIPNHKECLPILIDKDDYFFGPLGIRCIANFRSQPCYECKIAPRQQFSVLTAFIDASPVYGSDTKTATALRAFKGGRLLTQWNEVAGELLPASNSSQTDPKSFKAGDVRVNQHPALISMHTLFMREHNRLVKELACINPEWDDEKLYQIARRIVGALFQMITWNEFLPVVLGKEMMEYFDLAVRSSGYTKYKSYVRPSIVNEFTVAAFRFGHSMINTTFPEHKHHGYKLRDVFNYFAEIYQGQVERVMPCLTRSSSQQFDRHLVPDVTNHLYKPRGSVAGSDLASLNVLRGRDHGTAPYVEYVKLCGGPNISRFSQLDSILRPGYSKKFRKLYKDPRDIDLFSGGVCEKPYKGGVVGPTFACIIGTQFSRFKDGDRFYFEHGKQVGSFTPAQLREIRKQTLARIMCDNLEINNTQKYVMTLPSHSNPIVRCKDIPKMSLHAWRDRRH